MPTSSVSVTTPNPAQADGLQQADGFVSPITPGQPIGANGTHSKGPAQLPMGAAAAAGQFYALSTSDGLTAHAGGGKASALQLTSQFNDVTTVATAADSAMLPPSSVGLWCVVRNGAANAMQLFGNGNDTINGVATGTGVSVAGGKTAILFCGTAGAWVGPIALA